VSVTGGTGPRVSRKWRPPIGLVVFAVLATVLLLPLAGVFFFRIYENQLVRETEGELIAQSASLTAAYKREVEAEATPDVMFGPRLCRDRDDALDEPYSPISPSLDLASNELMPRRPEALPAHASADPAFLAIGARLRPVILETQQVTLAGVRLLDPHGVVIAGREETGLSLAHVEEVAAALRGCFRSVLRLRVSKHEPPPLYSMSRGTGLRIFAAMPVIIRDRVAGVVYVSRTPSNVFKHLYDERGKVIVASLAVLALAMTIGVIFNRTITRPVRELIARTTSIAAGDHDALRPLTHHGTAEFAQLSQSFLDMAASLHSRSDFIATFAAHVSHELKSPLTSIQGAAELLRDDIGALATTMSDEMRRKFLDNIAADALRLTLIVNRLRELARAEQSPTNGSCVLASIIADLRAAFPMLDVRLSGDGDQVVRISAENARIVFSHLADNSARHAATRLEIEAARKGMVARVIVRDNGVGISAGNSTRIFESFFTTRRDSGGTGMGLPIVRAMLLAHGGNIHLVCADQGAAFELTFAPAGEDDV
jgi:signal transduction histidine kinase